MRESRREILKRINEQTAQEYQRLQNRLRSEPDHELEWPFPLTKDDKAFIRAVMVGDWNVPRLKGGDT